MPDISIVLYAMAGFFMWAYGYVRGATTGPMRLEVILVFVLGLVCAGAGGALESATGAAVVMRMLCVPFVGFVVGVLVGNLRARSQPPAAQPPDPRDQRQYEHEE